MECVRPSLTWLRILSTCVKSMWRNDIKCKYMFMFPRKNLACKGLIHFKPCVYVAAGWGSSIKMLQVQQQLQAKNKANLNQPRVSWHILTHWGRNKMAAIFQTTISIKISLNFVPKGSINNIPSLVQIMAWCRPDGKPLSEPMMDRSMTHICVTRPQWVN